MSDNFNQNKFDEDIFLALFRKGANEYLEDDFLKDIPPEHQRDKVQFSETFEKRMKKIINQAIKKEKRKRRIKRIPMIAAIIFVVLLILSITAYKVEAFRTRFMDMLVETNDIATDINLFSNQTDNNGIDVGDMTLPKYIPNGYQLSSSEVTPGLIFITYKHTNGNKITITRISPEVASGMGMDTENADYGYFDINSYKAFYCYKNGYSQIVFTTEDYAYHILGENLPLEEAKKFAESIK